MATADTAALDTIIGQCRRFREPDVKPLLTNWERRIKADTFRGLDAGTDKDGNDFRDVTYRPKGKAQPWTHKAQRAHLAGASNIRRGGRGEETANNNLTSAQYRRLTGKPLVPRGRGSRLYTNLYTGQGYDSSRGVFYAVAGWAGIVSRKGKEFMIAHFDGLNGLPKRDARGIRPQGQQECLDDLESWGATHLKATFV